MKKPVTCPNCKVTKEVPRFSFRPSDPFWCETCKKMVVPISEHNTHLGMVISNGK